MWELQQRVEKDDTPIKERTSSFLIYLFFPQNKCFPCSSEGCPQMGFYADRFPGKTNGVGQKFYLNTGEASDFARKSILFALSS